MKMLRPILLFTLVIFTLQLQAQETKKQHVRFVTTIDIRQATKDGIYLEGYVVNIPYQKLQELNGKTVQISGKVTIVKGIGTSNGGEISQGREKDTMHILKPKIKLVSN